MTPESSNKVLIITYYWPPSGGAGVQRWFKFAKYLPEYGWEPVILTIDPEYAAYPVTDKSLAAEMPEGLKVFTTKATDFFRIYKKDKSKIPTAGFATSIDNSFKGKLLRFIRGNFFIPDPRKGWNKYAFRKACELIDSMNISHVITTSPPHSTQLMGIKLKKRFPSIKWIADLRDPWTDIYYYDLFYPTPVSRSIDRRYENMVLSQADSLITVGQNLAEAFKLKNNSVRDKILVITNGYDDRDFQNLTVSNPVRFTITYVGTLSEVYPIYSFLEAISRIKQDFLLRFAGTVPQEIRSKIIEAAGINRTEFVPYCPHSEAVRIMTESSILLLIIPETKQSKVITTGKVFEYMASRRPVLYIGPEDGDAAVILRNAGYNGIFSGKESNEISEFIKGEIENPSGVMKEANEYSRKNLTGKLAELLRGI
ncbi:MAG TPA: glycosyltransferase family 4 protein [Bacteroidales bacterium]|nr:glycosyltransferase family 4 protein [Bacteroidales bacterium]